MELETLEVKIQAQARQANDQIDVLITRLGKLSSSLQSIDSSGINRLATGVNRLSNSMSAMRSVDSRSFSTLARNIKTLGSIDTGKTNAAAGAMRQISKSVSSFSGMSKSVQGLSELAGGIKQLGYTSSTKAIENIPKLAVAMRQLMAELSKAPMVSQNLINMTNALAKLARTGGAAGTAARSITSSFGGFTSGASSATKKSFSLASAIGKLYASYFLLFRGFGKIRDAIDISSSLTEVENVVRTTFGKYESLVNDFAANSIQKFGMSELSVKQFASRFQAMGVAMGFSQGKMADMSINLTKLTADMASFYDVAQSDVAEDLESIFTGQTRPLRAYGLDLTQATLKEWALTQGIEVNFKTMTQAEKAMLRYQYVMANTAAAQGDFARTADTWHNQVTILKQSFQQLAGIIGGALINAFKPFIKVLNSVLQKVIAFAKMVTNALGSIFGWKYEASDVGITDDLADSYGNVADAANDAANGTKKAAKEAKKSTRAFDELKVISSNKDKGSSGSGSGSSGGGGGASGSSGKLVAADTIFKDYESKIKDLEGLGKSISGALINAMKGIKWDKIYAKASGFGSGLAKFLNGLFEGQKGTTLFGETGRLIANALNTVLHGLDSFGTTVDWKQFGNSIADGVNKFFQNFDFALLAQTLNTWAQGAFDAVTTALSKISWKDVWKGVKEFLSNLDVKTVEIIIGALTIKKILGLHLAKAALAVIGTSISKAIASSIASKLGVEIAANQGIGSVLSTALSGKINGALATLGTTISAGFKALFGNKAAEGALAFISPVAKAITGIETVATGAFTAISNFVSMLKNGFSWLNEALMLVGITITAVGAVILGVAAAPAAIVAGVTAAVATVAVLLKDNWKTVVDTFSGVGDWFNTNVITPVVGFFKGMYTKVSGFFSNLWKSISGVWGKVSGWFNKTVIEPIVGFFKGFYTRVHQIFQGLWIIIQAVWKVVSDWFSKNVIEPIKGRFEFMKTAVCATFKALRSAIKMVWSVVSAWFKDHVVDPIKKHFDGVKERIDKAFKEAKTAITNAWSTVSNWFSINVTTPIKNAFSTMKKKVKEIFDDLWKSVKNGVSGAMNTVIARIESAINSLIRGVNKVLSGFNNVVSVAAKVVGVDWSGVDLVKEVKLPRVKAYATGGFMDKYSIAKVGENGIPELMGTVGGKPAVAGGQEITGIKDAINSTSAKEVSLLRQQNQLLQAILQKNFGITTNDIGKAARDYGREYYNRTGDNAYVF
nr:MAG TPA: minor tail protein [Caudoviricetes sp.]